jgi:hypothetical protein
MSKTAVEKEWRRLQQDFEAQAGRYHDLTLSIDFLTPQHMPDLPTEKPNYAAVLWQYFGNAGNDFDFDEFVSVEPTNYGHPKAKVIAYGLIVGEQTDLFRRMAHRAGSLLPDEVRFEMARRIMENVADPTVPGKPIFGSNSDPLAVWLNFVLMIGSTLQPERFNRRTLPIDPFTASLTAVEFLLDYSREKVAARDVVDMAEFSGKRFKVALSFPGERRKVVSIIADELSDRLGRGSVFYDMYYEAELARPNMDTLLQKIYRDNSDLVVVFLCEEYEKKEWCGLEWRAIRDLIKKRRDEDVMLMRFDSAEIPGIFSTDGYIDLGERSPGEAVDLICRRLLNRKPNSDNRREV